MEARTLDSSACSHRSQGRRISPKPLALQVGSQQTHPDELIQVGQLRVSDSGECAPLTPLRRQGRRVYPKPLALQVGSQQTHPDELTLVSDSGA
ncbi:hypothetical protein [Yersinia kristensenii]|nr:hypothetical protein CU276_20130 [Yersinia kristensenii]